MSSIPSHLLQPSESRQQPTSREYSPAKYAATPHEPERGYFTTVDAPANTNTLGNQQGMAGCNITTCPVVIQQKTSTNLPRSASDVFGRRYGRVQHNHLPRCNSAKKQALTCPARQVMFLAEGMAGCNITTCPVVIQQKTSTNLPRSAGDVFGRGYGRVQHNHLPRCNLAKKQAQQDHIAPAWQVMFWAESFKCNSPLF